MKWRRLLVISLALIAVSAAINHWYGVRTEKKREASFQRSLNYYSETFQPGVNRKKVEDYFRAHGIHVEQGFGQGSLDAETSFVRIGEYPAPWYCSAQGVYIAFQFTAAEKHDRYEARDSDVLKRVQLENWGEGCL